MDRPEAWAVDESSEHECFFRWIATEHEASDEQRVADRLADIRLAPLERGVPQEVVGSYRDPLTAIYWARVRGANIGILYVVNLEEKAVFIADIGPARSW